MVVLTVAGTLFSAAPASAHSKLVSSSPQAGSILDTSPPRIELELSESVGVQFSTITVYNRERQEQPLGAVALVPGSNTKMYVDVTGTLPGGTYTVVWRAISAVDGHLTAGTFAFRVRGAPGQATPEPEGTPAPIQGVGDSTNPI